MNYGRHSIWVLFIIFFLISGFGLPSNIEKKVKKEIVKIFKIDDFSIKAIEISNNLNTALPVKITGDNLYGIKEVDSTQLGYAFVDQALGKTAKFDYLIIFDNELRIVHSKVLAYREEYGGEIGSKRWLKQFLGKTGGDRVDHESNIDGIAGATISVRSMTIAIDNLLRTIEMLQKNQVL